MHLLCRQPQSSFTVDITSHPEWLCVPAIPSNFETTNAEVYSIPHKIETTEAAPFLNT